MLRRDLLSGHINPSQQADQTYQDTVETAATARDQTIANAHSTFENTKSDAGTDLAVALSVCHGALSVGIAGCASGGLFASIFTFGAAFAACMAVVAASYAYCTGSAISTYDNLVDSAREIRNLSIQLARADFQAAKQQAAVQRDLAKAEAAATLTAALQEAEDDLDDCLEDCAPKPHEPVEGDGRF